MARGYILIYLLFPLFYLLRALHIKGITYLSNYFGRHKSESSISSLSDELVTDILRRVPAHNILACKAVCSLWRRLTNTEQFTESHLNNTPVILGWHSPNCCFYFINNIGNDARFPKVVEVQSMDITRHALEFFRGVRASYNGLLFFGDNRNCGDSKYTIFNPVTREEVTFRLSNRDIVCGFYYHRVEKEYKLLIYHSYRYNDEHMSKYSIYGLSSPHRKTLGVSNKIVSTIADAATCGALFWTMSLNQDRDGIILSTDNIVMFDVDTETFVVRPQPGNRYKRGLCTQVKLLDIEGKLGCCNVYLNSVQVWILEDIEKWKWVNKYTVSFGRHISKNGDKRRRLVDVETSVVGFQDGNLLLCGKVAGLMWCNLRSNMISKINTDNLPGWEIDDEYGCRYDITGMHYVSSFVSLEKLNMLPLSLDRSLFSDDVTDNDEEY